MQDSETPSITVDGVSVPVLVRRNARARRYILRLRHDGQVTVTIPAFGSRREALSFLGRHHGWIERQHRRHRELAANRPPDDLVAVAKGEGAAKLAARAWEIARELGQLPARIAVRRHRSRWGSCSRRGWITLNWRLSLAPDWVRDYVIVHELMHLREHNHGQRYWALVEAAFPRRRDAEAWLRREGRALLKLD